jgi:hypothetical protein
MTVRSLNRGDAAKAIDELRVAMPFERGWHGDESVGFHGTLYPIYFRGLAVLAARQPAHAAAEFQKTLDNRGLIMADPIGIMALVQLARASTLAGDRVVARSAYDRVLAQWESVDSGIPMITHVKAEYAKL